jgi:hypothetical protein
MVGLVLAINPSFKRIQVVVIKILFLIHTIIWFSGCSSLVPDPIRKNTKSEGYTFSVDDNYWQKTNPDISDHAFYSQKTGSHLFINSLCKKYQDTNLASQMDGMFAGIKRLKTTSKEFNLKNRLAIETTGIGEVDGVQFTYKVITINYHHCVYDFALLSARPEIKSTDLDNFQKLLATIEFNNE